MTPWLSRSYHSAGEGGQTRVQVVLGEIHPCGTSGEQLQNLLYTMAHSMEGAGSKDKGTKKDDIKFVGDVADAFPKLQRQVATGKGSLTKALTAMEKQAVSYGSLSNEEELLTSQRYARSFVESVEKVEIKKSELEEAFESLIKHVNDMIYTDFEPQTDPGIVVESAESSREAYITNAEEKVGEQDALVKRAEQILSKQLQLQNVAPGAPQCLTAGPGGPPSGGPAIPVFRPLSDLKPNPIEKNSTYREVVFFIEVFFNYLSVGYGGTSRIPQNMVAVQLMPFVCESWWATMVELGIKSKSVEEVKKVILQVAGIHVTLHDRRLDFLRSKKEGKCHSEYLRELEEKIELTDWENWTKNQMIATLFLTSADIEISKVVTTELAKPTLNMAELKAQIRNIESSTWYRGPKATAKVAGGGAAGGVGGAGGGARWCTRCERDTHNTDMCWGPCGNCSRFGHKTELCRNPKSEAKKLAEADAEAKKAKKLKLKQEKAERKRKQKEKEKKEKEEAQRKLDAVKKITVSTSSSDCESPVHVVDARAARAGGPRARRVGQQSGNFYTFPNVGSIHEDIEQKSMEELEAEFGRVKLARKDNASPTIEGKISGNSKMTHSTTQPFVCDTGCSWPVISDKIILTMGIPIRPFKKRLNIVDASGNNLKLLGSSKFFISIPQVLGEDRVEPVEAAVLADNEVDAELLVSMSLLLAWDLIPPLFPRQTVTAYFNSLSENRNKIEKCDKVFSSVQQTEISENESYKLPKPSPACTKLREKILGKYTGVFKESLSKDDRINCPPVRLKINPEANIKAVAHTKPYDCPWHMRKALDREIKLAVEAGILTPCDQATAWCHQLFPVMKPGKVDECRIVCDFRRLNAALERPVFPTESSMQMLRHLDGEAVVFATLDMVQGYHQLVVAPEDRHLLTVISQYGRHQYTCLGQGITSASDFFNYFTDGKVRYEGFEAIHKNTAKRVYAGPEGGKVTLMIFKVLFFLGFGYF